MYLREERCMQTYHKIRHHGEEKWELHVNKLQNIWLKQQNQLILFPLNRSFNSWLFNNSDLQAYFSNQPARDCPSFSVNTEMESACHRCSIFYYCGIIIWENL